MKKFRMKVVKGRFRTKPAELKWKKKTNRKRKLSYKYVLLSNKFACHILMNTFMLKTFKLSDCGRPFSLILRFFNILFKIEF